MWFYILLAICFPYVLTSSGCPKNGICKEELERRATENYQRRMIEQVPDMAFSAEVLRNFDNSSRQMYQDWLEEYNEERPDLANDEEVKIDLIQGTDPSAGEDRSQLVAIFELKDELDNTHLVDANLLFATIVPASEQHKVQDVSVQIFEKNEDNSLGQLVVTGVFSIKGSQRVRVELPVKTVKNWFSSKSTISLFVSAIINGRNVAIHPQQTSSEGEVMILQLSTKHSGVVTVSRSRRSTATPVCTKENPSAGCCLYDLVIEFDKIGWDWIIAPPKYNAYVCRGDCRLNSHHFMNDFGHSKVMRSASRSMDEVSNSNVGFCCHPVDYDYIRLIYVNRNGRVSVANVNGMIARRCGCS
uniref:TGF_BETA_2 domain-containing protein n=1 Tax=Caenorhabditis tropicalis TaxID=1561998 RepID=A0A1I7UJS0_9PELO